MQPYPQQYPPQYGPPPAGYPQQMPAQYPAPGQYAPAPQPAPAPGYGGAHPQGVPPFHAPAAPQANIVRPRLLDFGREGRLVLISPIKIERGLPNTLGKPGETQDRMTADVVVLDGAPFAFGGAPEKGEPHTHTAGVPYEIVSMYLSSGPLISQCERRLGEMVLGRIGIRRLPNGNTAYRLDDPTEADSQVARQYLVDKQAGRIAPPQQIPATQPYAPPQGQQPQYAPGGQVQPQQQYMTQPAPVPPYAGQQPPMPPSYGGIGGGYAPEGHTAQYSQPAPQSAPPAAAPPPAAVALDLDTPPVGWTVDQWQALPQEHRQMFAASMASRPGI